MRLADDLEFAERDFDVSDDRCTRSCPSWPTLFNESHISPEVKPTPPSAGPKPDDLILKNHCRVKGCGTDRVTERRIPDVNQVAALTQAMPEQYRAAVIVAAWRRCAGGRCSVSSGVTSTSWPAGPSGAHTSRVPRRFARPRADQEPQPTQGLPAELVLPALEDHLRRFVGSESDTPLFTAAKGERLRPSARGACGAGEVEGEVLELPPLTSENDEKCSGGETRTLNLAVNSRLLCH